MASTMLSHQSSTGFYKATLCKGLMASCFITGTAVHIPMFAHLRQYLTLEIPSALMSRNVLRLIFNRLTFVHSKDIICSALLLYYFRIFERRMGSRKFSNFLLGCCTISTILEVLVIMLLKFSDVQYIYSNNQLPPGLYSLIFPMFVYYFFDIPRISATSFLGIPFTGKTMTYLLGLQIAASSAATASSSICGLVAGVLYRCNFLKVQKWLVVPNMVFKLCDKIFGWFLVSNEPKYRQQGATVELQRQEQAEIWEQEYVYNQDFRQQARQGQGFAERLIDDQQDEGLAGFLFRRRGQNSANNGEPSPENIRILVDMGFEESRVLDALRSSRNDLETATSILLRQ